MIRELERSDLFPFVESDKNPGCSQARFALCLILEQLDNEHALMVVDCFTACQVWKYLEGLYEFQEDGRLSCSPLSNSSSTFSAPRNPRRYNLAVACENCRRIGHKTRHCPHLKDGKNRSSSYYRFEDENCECSSSGGSSSSGSSSSYCNRKRRSSGDSISYKQ